MKPSSTFGFLRLTAFIRSLRMLTIPFISSTSPPSAGSFSDTLQHLLTGYTRGYIVPRASYHSVTQIACLGRKLLAQQQAISVTPFTR